MAERTIRIGSAHGLHARPAKLFTQEVSAVGVPVTIAKGDGAAVNAASILAVIALGIDHGDEVTLTTESADTGVLDRLEALLVADHDA
ncbi:HPr family phosphocarrier protein [Luethyella okanaganae]|uniref:HPr family phosphocarrier protein n=1 Tax=Luethyella okanaganae TaxID=69372 RepID=A0ABW1VGJ1_9MICO